MNVDSDDLLFVPDVVMVWRRLHNICQTKTLFERVEPEHRYILITRYPASQRIILHCTGKASSWVLHCAMYFYCPPKQPQRPRHLGLTWNLTVSSNKHQFLTTSADSLIKSGNIKQVWTLMYTVWIIVNLITYIIQPLSKECSWNSFYKVSEY